MILIFVALGAQQAGEQEGNKRGDSEMGPHGKLLCGDV